jgi:hypothetical protein
MPDLSTEKISAWLYAREPAIATELAREFPSVEDGQAILPSVLRLGRTLDDVLTRAPDRLRECLHQERTLALSRVVLAQINRGRRLRLLHWLTESPGLADLPASLLVDDGSDCSAYLRAEIRALHQRTLLARIFHQDRIAELLAASQQAAQTEPL